MSTRTSKEKQTPGRDTGEESEPFLVPEIPGSPVIRGRRPRYEGEPFVVENLSRSPVLRGKRRNSGERESLIRDTTTRPILRSDDSRMTLPATSDVVDSARPSPRIEMSRIRFNRDPEKIEDAPPTYEASIAPRPIGWVPDITSTVPIPDNQTTPFRYPPCFPTDPTQLPAAYVSHLSVDSQDSKTFGSSSHRSSPSPTYNRPSRSAYYLQPKNLPQITTSRPFRVDCSLDDAQNTKSEEVAAKYGSMVLGVVFIIFIIVISLCIRYFINLRRVAT